MIKCNKCALIKKIEDFSYKNKNLDKRHSVCKECTRKVIKAHYENNKGYYLTKTKSRNNDLRNEASLFIKGFLMKHPCVDCGEKDLRVLEFDHRKDSVKLKAVSTLVRYRVNLDVVKNEIAKCEVRCANCHRRKTSFDFNWFRK